jgi:hypothetical protein
MDRFARQCLEIDTRLAIQADECIPRTLLASLRKHSRGPLGFRNVAPAGQFE